MTTVYRKSSKGQQEIETRANRLAPRLRMALILVDGRRTDTELRALIQSDADATLRALVEGGYVEVAMPQAGAASPGATPAATPTATPAAPPATSASSLAERRRLAVRHLTDQLGPVVEELAMRIEKTRTWPELLPVLELGRSVLHNARGSAAAARFAALFIDSPPA